MLRPNNFIKDFQKDHVKLLNLIASFRSAIESSEPHKAKENLTEIEELSNRHFNFEENYLYPRLRRLILEITGNLHREQETLKGFIRKSRDILQKNKLAKDELSELIGILPRLSKFFQDCNELIFLAERFNREDIEDLERRFKECCRTKNLVVV